MTRTTPAFLRLLPALLAIALPAWAGEFEAMVSALKKTWPERTVIAVVCDTGFSKGRLDALAAACGGMKIAAVDVKSPQDVGKAVGALGSQHAQVLVLIPGDRITGDGAPGATFLIQRLAASKIPAIATSEAALKQGAVFAVGAGTGGKLLTNPKAATVSGVSAPEGGTPVS